MLGNELRSESSFWIPAVCMGKKNMAELLLLLLLHQGGNDATDVPAHTVRSHSLCDDSPRRSRQEEGEGWVSGGGGSAVVARGGGGVEVALLP